MTHCRTSLIAIFLPLLLAAAPATRPSAFPAMNKAYQRLNSLRLAGTIDFSADIDGQTSERHADFTAAFKAPMRFRHEIKKDAIAAGTGSKVYLFLPALNGYVSADSPVDRGEYSSLPKEVQRILMAQDPSLALALADNPAELLIADAASISESVTTIDGQQCPTVTVALIDRDMTLILSPTTHLARRIIIDESRGLTQRGAHVNKAQVVIDYTQCQPDAPVTDAELAFTVPPTAQEMEGEAPDALALIGRPAPPFHLTGLKGEDVSSADLTGGVYVLCFCATWSGQSLLALPGLQQLQEQNKADGVKCFAIDQHEREATVRQVIGTLGLSIPVLLDTDGKTDAAYGAAAVPDMVVVGRDGIVASVSVGPGHDQDIAAAVADALSKPIVTVRPIP
jgi:peroxiredoxin